MILEKNLYKRKNRLRNVLLSMKRMVPYFWKLVTRKKILLIDKSSVLKGAPALTLKEDGNLRCTSCLLCQNLCPSHCIEIEVEKDKEEAAPVNFDINILRCTFCSLCEEVCPVDAIRMEGPMPMAGHSEQNWIFDKHYLMTYAGELQSKVGDNRPLLPY